MANNWIAAGNPPESERDVLAFSNGTDVLIGFYVKETESWYSHDGEPLEDVLMWCDIPALPDTGPSPGGEGR